MCVVNCNGLDGDLVLLKVGFKINLVVKVESYRTKDRHLTFVEKVIDDL